MRRRIGNSAGLLMLTGLCLFAVSPPVRAACSGPPGEQADIVYNSSHKVVQYCDGRDWIGMHPPGAGGGNCTNPPGTEGSLVYNPAFRVMQSCAGTDWQAVGPIGGTSTPSCDEISPWSSHAAAETSVWKSVTYGNGLFVAVASFGTTPVMTSPDGINWTAQSAAGNTNWSSVTYGDELFVAVENERVMVSPDGANWTAHDTAEDIGWTSVTYGDGLFVAVAWWGTNRVMTSPDGVNWTAHAAAEDNDWRDVTYGDGLFVAVAQDGTNRVMTSPDGVNWTARAAAEANRWQSVSYGDGLFVAVAQDGTNRVMTSPDGINWTARDAAAVRFWDSVTYGNGLFVAVDSATFGTTQAMTSPDGINWTAQSAAENTNWNSVAYGDGKFVAVAQNSSGPDQVMTAECLLPGCTDPERDEGAMIYNCARAVMQYCDGVNWVAIGKAPASTPDVCACEPEPGDVCADGTVYAGLSPDGDVKIYTTASDSGQLPWNDGNGFGTYTTTIQQSSVTGESNTAALITIDSDSSTAGTQPHQAAQACADLSAHGYDDWYLPAKDELDVLYMNRDAIGNFSTADSFPSSGYYWSSSERGLTSTWGQLFSDGSQSYYGKGFDLLIRCARK